MANHIKKDFSLYQHIIQTTPQNIFSNKRKMLAHWCASVEKELIEQAIPLTLFVGFQQLDYFVPVMKRYQLIAQTADYVFVFGEPSDKVVPIANLTYVYLSPDDKLRNEWFLIAHHKDYSRAIIAYETTPPNTPHEDRVFTGVLTNDFNNTEPIYQTLMTEVDSII